MNEQLIEEIASETFSILGTGRQVVPFSSRYPDFTLADAYRVAAKLRSKRAAHAETPVGRKIGFTNRSVWSDFGISGPIWNYMFDSTVRDLAEARNGFSLVGLSDARIEPEIVLHLARVPEPDMDDDALIDCIDWIAHGFEVVYSIFPGWSFTAADAVAAYGVHAALLIGDHHPISGDRSRWAQMLRNFTIELRQDDTVKARGHARDVLGGPVTALRFLVRELARYPASEPLNDGEVITTGTLTQALPAIAGAAWTTALSGIDLAGIRLRFSC